MKKPLLIALAVVLIGVSLFWLPSRQVKASASESHSRPTTVAARPTAAAPLEDPPGPVDAAPAAIESPDPVVTEPTPPRRPDMAKIEAFRDWMERWGESDEAGRQALRDEGARLAQERREEFKALIVTDPRRALEEAVPRVIRQDLPEEIVRHLEQPVAATGEYIKYLGTPAPGKPAPERKLSFQTFEAENGNIYQAHVFGEMEPVMWKKKMPIQGVAVDHELAVAENPVRKLQVGERIPEGTIVEQSCPVSGETTVAPSPGEVVHDDSPTVEIAERVITLCNGSHVTVLEEQYRTKLQASGPGGANVFVDNYPGTGARSIGNFKCLYIRVVYPDQQGAPNTEDSAYWDLANTTRFYLESSFGKMTTTAVVTPLVMLPHTKSWYYAKDGQVDCLGLIHGQAKGEARKLGYDSNQFDCTIVRVAGGPRLDGISWGGGPNVWLSWDGMDVMNHECGHSLGLNHANSWVNTDGTGYGNGHNGEYGNPFDVMGGGGGFGAHYNTISKRALGWLPPAYVHQPVANGTYRIYAYDQPRLEEGKRYSLVVGKDGYRAYNLEFHNALGGQLSNSALVIYSGVGSNAGNIIDTTPGSAGGLGDGGIQVGRTFSDLESDIHLTVVSKNNTDPVSLDIVYNRGPFAGNLPPSASLAASSTSISPSGSVTFTASATDPNGDPLAYLWEFDDGVAGTNTPVFTRNFASTAQVTAMLTVSDMKGGVTRRNVVINVGSHGLQTVSGNIAWNSQPLQNARVACGGKYCFTDADGNYALSGIATGSQTLSATLNGYTFTPLFSNPLAVVAGTNTANWTASNATNFVSLQKLADAAEGGASGGLRFTRSGDTSAALDVRIAPVGGTATRTNDYVFNPDAVADGGYLKFTIPAGQTTLDVAVNPVNDTAAEGPETLAMQLSLNGTYLSTSANSVAMTLGDNDTSLPLVSVAAGDSSAAESPADSGSVTFTRSGSTVSALDIPVSWIGSARNGTDYTGLPTTVTIPAGQSSTTFAIDPVNDVTAEGPEDVIASINNRPDNWVRLVRSGSTFTGYRSFDGVTWTQVSSATVSMNSSVLVGLAANAHNNTLATATFDNVSVTPGVSALVGADIGGVAHAGSTYEYNGVYTLQGSGPDIWGTADGFHFASATLNGNGEIRARVSSVTGSDPWAKIGVMFRETSAAGSKNVLMCIGGEYDFQYRAGTDGGSAWVSGGALNTTTPYVCDAAARTATVSLNDDDPSSISVSVPDASASEAGPDSGVFLITRSGSTAAPLKVYYGISGTAHHGTDYRALNGEVTIPAGVASAPVVITPIDDDLGEGAETVTLAITTFNNAYSVSSASSGSLTIGDNADIPLISVRPGWGQEGGGNAVVVFRSIGTSGGNVTVNYTVSGTATAGVDYTALSGTVSVPVNGTTDTTVTIPILNDSLAESAETVVVKITPAAGYRVYNDGTAAAILYDNDTADRVKLSNWPDAPSENGGGGRFYFSRTGTTGDLTVNYAISGTATNGADYTSLTGSVIIPDGQSGVDLMVSPLNDTDAEGTETVTLTVDPASGYGADEPCTATLYIADNDSLPVTVGFASASQSTTEQPGANGEYRDVQVNLSAASSNSVTVEYFSNGGSSTGDDVDWAFVDAIAGNAVIPRGVLTFPPGITSQNIRVRIKNDGASESAETAALLLVNARFAAIGTNQHTITITDGVTTPYTLRFATNATTRGEPQGTEPNLMALLDQPCGATPITVDYTVGGTATAGADFQLSPGTITFNQGEQGKVLPLTILQDGIADAGETIVVSLTNPTGAQLDSPSTHTVTLVDESYTPGIWANASGGSWGTGGNWSDGSIAYGSGNLADFSKLDLTSDATVTLDGQRLVGSLVFSDFNSSHDWILNAGSGGSLTLDVASGSPTITVNNQTATLGLPIGGTAGLNKAGAGTLALTGANTYTGDTTLNGGTLQLGGASGTALSGDLTIAPGGNGYNNGVYLLSDQTSGVIHFNSSGYNYVRPNGHAWTVAGLDGNSGVGVVENGGYNQNVSAAGTIALNVASGASYTFAGFMRNADGSGGTGLLNLVKNGPGTQSLAGNNIGYSGTTTINAGSLILSQSNSDWTLPAGTKTIASGATLKVDLSPQTTQYRKTHLGATDVGGALELHGTVDNVNSHYLINTWTASGAGTIRITGGGSVSNWTGSTNSLAGFTGLLDIQNGRFAANINSTSTLGGTLDVNLAAAGKLDLRSGHLTIDAFDGAAGSQVHKSWLGDSINFTIGSGNGSGTFAGVMTGSNFSVIKTGTGTETLAGANTYTGATAVNGGTLLVNGSLGNTSTTVAAAGTLGGTGSIAGAVANNGTLAPGSGAAGNLTVTNTLTLASASAMAWEITNWTGAAGTGWDKLTANSLNITATTGSPVTIRISDPALANFTNATKSFVLAQTTSGITGFSAGKFVIDTSGTSLNQGDWTIAQAGNNLQLTYTPWNQAPAFTTDPVLVNATEDAPLTGQLAATDPNAGDSLTYTKVSGPAWLSVSSTGALSGTPLNSNVGPNNFVVSVSDSGSLSDTADLVVTVANTNDAPAWTAPPLTKPDASEGMPYSASLAGDASDVDAGDTLTFAKVSGPAWLGVSSAGALSGTPGSADAGANAFTVRVTDAAGASADATLNVTVLSTNGVWTNAAGGSWPVAGNWSGGNIANGMGKTADFSTLNLAANATVTLDGSRLLGNLTFGDTTPSHDWTLNAGSGGALTLDVASGSPAITVNNQTATLGLPLAGTKGLSKTGAGILTLAGSNTYSGGTTLNDGVLQLGGASGTALGSGDLTLATGVSGYTEGVYLTTDQSSGVIHFHSSTWNYVRSNGHNWTVAGLDNPTGTSNNGVVENGGCNKNVSTSGTVTLNVGAGNSHTYAGIIRNADAGGGSGLLSLVKTGAGTQTLKGSNFSYTGGTTVTAGVLRKDVSGVTGQQNWGSMAADGTLELYNTNLQVDNILLTGTTTITGTGTLTKTGAGYIGLWSDTDTIKNFAGDIDIQAGALGSNGNGWENSAGLMNLNVASNAWFDVRTQNVVINQLSGAGTVGTSYTGAKTLIAGNNHGSSTFAGVIQNTITGSNFTNITSGGTLAFTKQGNGIMTLTGTNTYTGATTVSAGILRVNGSLANTATIVAAAGTLGGTGSIGGAVTNNGTLAPGSSGTGNLTVTNAVTLASASAVEWQVTDWTGSAGTGWDKLTANSLNITATSGSPVIIRLTDPGLANFTDTDATFVLVQTTSGITGFASSKFIVDDIGLALPQGTWNVQQTGNNLVLAYTHAGGSPGIHPDLSADADHDGLPDIIEAVFGTDSGTANASAIQTQLAGNQMVLTFPRSDASETMGVQLAVEAGDDLASWPQVFHIGATTETSSPGVAISENGDEPDTITVTIPTGGAPRCFSRLKAATN